MATGRDGAGAAMTASLGQADLHGVVLVNEEEAAARLEGYSHQGRRSDPDRERLSLFEWKSLTG